MDSAEIGSKLKRKRPRQQYQKVETPATVDTCIYSSADFIKNEPPFFDDIEVDETKLTPGTLQSSIPLSNKKTDQTEAEESEVSIRCTDYELILPNHKINIEHLFSHKRKGPCKRNVCNTRLRQGTTVEQHMETHAGEEAFQCEICKKSFQQETILKAHLLLNFRCRRKLQSHIKTHSGNQTYNSVSGKESLETLPKLKRHTDRLHGSFHLQLANKEHEEVVVVKMEKDVDAKDTDEPNKDHGKVVVKMEKDVDAKDADEPNKDHGKVVVKIEKVIGENDEDKEFINIAPSNSKKILRDFILKRMAIKNKVQITKLPTFQNSKRTSSRFADAKCKNTD